MISNKEISKALNLCAQLMDLHGENEFKIRSFANAAFKIGKLDMQLAMLSPTELANIEGIGKTINSCLTEILTKGQFDELTRLASITPPGVLEMLAIKGIGPKKIAVIWKDLQIESIGELLYACNENRLIDLKGFGAKTQEQVKKAIEFKISSSGKFHYAVAEHVANNLLDYIAKAGVPGMVSITGDIRMKNEIIETIDLLSTTEITGLIDEFSLLYNPSQIPIRIEIINGDEMAFSQFISSSSPAHRGLLKSIFKYEPAKGLKDERQVYEAVGINYIVPEMRNGLHEFDWAKKHTEEELITLKDIKGVLHCHSSWSDGINSLEDMAKYCISQGYEYLGICDHSQSAFYARGLNPEKVLLQQEEIEALNAKLAPFKIFKGIESDILYTGDLDYPEQILKSFDFIVASVHSNLKMNQEKAMERLLKAIENPFTTILGHMTGRLLLSRQGYPVDYYKIIDACAANGVIIELNANPYRLDMDWRYIHYAMEKGVKIAINPDAHQKETIHDMHYGVCVARKAGLTKGFTFNTLGLTEVAAHFESRA
jgi:DNA polymerase (family X)